jgi:ABC-type Fe3+-hydroxamate transport system substrate-binding protein
VAPGEAAEERPAGAQRVISLSPAVTEVLVALGAAGDLVGVDRFSLQVPGVGDVPSLGALFSPDLERAIEAEPTLVFGVAGQQQQGFFEYLRARGVRVETLSPYTLTEVLDSYAQIGALVGRADEGAALRDAVERELAEIRASVRGTTPSVAVVLERQPLYVVGGGSFVSELIEAAGGRNAFADLDAPYPVVSLEVLAERAPAVLVDTSVAVAAGGEAAVAEAREHWSVLPHPGRVETVPQGVVTLPGARLAEAARILRDKIHPGAGG